MNQETKQPDFSFILNQQGQAEPQPPKNRKFLVIIGAGVAMLLILVVVAVLVSKQSTSNVQQSAAGVTEANQFLQNVSNQKNDDAYNMMKASVRPDKDFFDNTFVKTYSQRFDLTKCTLLTDKVFESTTVAQLYYQCPYSNNSQNGSAVIVMVLERPSNLILSIKLKLDG